MTQESLETQQREKGWAAVTSVVAAIFLTGIKITIGIMTGSLGILAEAAHSGLDLVAALITLFAVRVSDRPADESHLYGHGKVENLSALAETLLLLLTCVWIIYEAINRLFFENVQVDPSIWAFLTMGISIVIDYSRSRVLYRAAKKYNSQALEADALHFSTDIWSSSVVIGGLALVKLGEWLGQTSILVKADAFSALIVAMIVVYVSVQLGKRTIDGLLDTAPSGLAAQIVSATQQVEGVRQVTRARVRGSGNQMFVDLRVAVPRHLSFEASHAVTRKIQEAVHAVSPNADVVVHTVPIAENEGVLETIEAIAAREHFSVHNITTHRSKRGVWIDLDLEVDPTISFERAHAMATDLETHLRNEILHDARFVLSQVADINVHIEPRAAELVEGRDMSHRDSQQYRERIQAMAQAIPHAHGCQDVALQRMNGGVYVSLHLQIDVDQSVADAHIISEEMENCLRREFPELGRVMIHAEPYRERKPEKNAGK